MQNNMIATVQQKDFTCNLVVPEICGGLQLRPGLCIANFLDTYGQLRCPRKMKLGSSLNRVYCEVY